MAKRRKRRSTRRKKQDSGKLGAMLFGVFVGIAIAATALWFLTPAGERPALPVAEREAPQAEPEAKAPDKKPPEPIEPSGKGYDFYDMLPEQEVLIDEGEATETTGTGSSPRASRDALVEEGLYMLQAGSFRNADGAERIKAQLALQGIVARVRPVPSDSGTLHQVRVGPVDRDTANDYLRRVRNAGIDVSVFRARP
ncbi:MAG: SPOR domain-containing protein [Pseudomonadota bacterium]